MEETVERESRKLSTIPIELWWSGGEELEARSQWRTRCPIWGKMERDSRGRERGETERDEVFWTKAKLVAVLVLLGKLQLDLYIGRHGQFAGGRYFRRGKIFSRASFFFPACARASKIEGGAE